MPRTSNGTPTCVRARSTDAARSAAVILLGRTTIT